MTITFWQVSFQISWHSWGGGCVKDHLWFLQRQFYLHLEFTAFTFRNNTPKSGQNVTWLRRIHFFSLWKICALTPDESMLWFRLSVFSVLELLNQTHQQPNDHLPGGSKKCHTNSFFPFNRKIISLPAYNVHSFTRNSTRKLPKIDLL